MKRLIIILFMFVLSYINAEIKSTSLPKIAAESFDVKIFEKMSDYLYGEVNNGKRVYVSDQNKQEVILTDKGKVTQILVKIDGKKTSFEVEGQVSYVRLRPKYTSFFYSVFDENSGGDFGTSSLYYVEVKNVGKTLKCKIKEIWKNKIDTDIGWSRDGKFFAYSKASTLVIRDFENNVEWIMNKIEIDKHVIISEGEPKLFQCFIWDEKNKHLIFSWKNHPFDDKIVGVMKIDLRQVPLK